MKITLDGTDAWMVELDETMMRGIYVVDTIHELKKLLLNNIEKDFDKEVNKILIKSLTFKNEINK